MPVRFPKESLRLPHNDTGEHIRSKCILSRANFRIRGHDSVCSSAAPFALTARVDPTTLTIDRPRARARIRERAIR
jgi:hypothetical protein